MKIPFLLTTLLIVAVAAPASAQRSVSRERDRDRERSRRADRDDDGNWLERCRRDDWGDRDRARFCEERTMGWRSQPGQSLTVDASPNGGVSVTGWDRDSVDVKVRIQTQADDDAEARDLAQRIRVVNENGTLRADGPSSRRYASWSVSFEIMAPRRVNLDLESVNGPLSAEDVYGTLRLNVQNGPLSLERVAGDVRAHAQNGPLHISLSGTRWDGVGLDAETTNGPLVLEIPEGYNAELETGTVNGPMELGFPVMVQGRIGSGSRRRLTTTLGTGGPRIRAVTTNGPAVLRRS